MTIALVCMFSFPQLIRKRRLTDWEDHDYVNLKSKMESTVRKGQYFAATSDLPTLMAYKSYYVVVGLQVLNWTKYPLLDPNAVYFSGYVSTAPIAIYPNKREALVVIR